jgi:hypothetical protein
VLFFPESIQLSLQRISLPFSFLSFRFCNDVREERDHEGRYPERVHQSWIQAFNKKAHTPTVAMYKTFVTTFWLVMMSPSSAGLGTFRVSWPR